MSEEKKPRQSGEFVIRNHALPPVKIDASGWPRSEGPRTSGDFVIKNHALPPVKVNMIVPEQVFLELHLMLAAQKQPESMASRIASFVDRLDALEQNLGGSGIVWLQERSSSKNGDLTIIVTANDASGAADRFKRLAKDIPGAIGPYLAASAVVAKVYRVTPGGERQDEFEIKQPGA
ncbi:MAG: hypothetical protein HY289_09160 [Planctomycetes bacterium]|nr:hypothetical protein [Planctomycetota bacterium]